MYSVHIRVTKWTSKEIIIGLRKCIVSFFIAYIIILNLLDIGINIFGM